MEIENENEQAQLNKVESELGIKSKNYKSPARKKFEIKSFVKLGVSLSILPRLKREN